jgi:amino acid transporter
MVEQRIIYLRIGLIAFSAVFAFAFVRGVSGSELLGVFGALCFIILFAILSLLHVPRSLYPTKGNMEKSHSSPTER